MSIRARSAFGHSIAMLSGNVTPTLGIGEETALYTFGVLVATSYLRIQLFINVLQ